MTATLRELLIEIESLRIKKQDFYKHHHHPQLKRFTQQELNDEGCKTYKNLLLGRSKRVPSRSTIMQIATYLECTLKERNNLLVLAGYFPEKWELEGVQLKNALEQAEQMMHLLPYPAMIVTNTLQVHTINLFFQQLFNIPVFTDIPKDQRSMLHFHFHPKFEIRTRALKDKKGKEYWEEHAKFGIDLFKQANRFSQYEKGYQDFVKQLLTIPDFCCFWNQDIHFSDAQKPFSEVIMSKTAPGDWLPIRVKQLFLSVGSYRYPSVVLFIPLDDAARKVFQELGCSVEPFAIN